MLSSRLAQDSIPPPAHFVGFSLSPDDLEKMQHIKLKIPKIDFETKARRRKIIQNLIHNSSDNATKIVPREHVIAFMDAIVKEHEYVVFKKYLTKECKIIKHNSKAKAIYDTLIKEHEKFREFDEDATWRAIDERISEVRSRHNALKLYHFRNYLRTFESIKWDSDISDDLKELEKRNFRGMNSDDKEEELSLYKRSLFRAYCMGCKGMDFYARQYPEEEERPYEPSNLISEIVFQTLEKDYVMDPDPEAELVNMKMSNPISYDELLREDPATFVTEVNCFKLKSGVFDPDRRSITDVTKILKLLLKYWFYSRSESKAVKLLKEKHHRGVGPKDATC